MGDVKYLEFAKQTPISRGNGAESYPLVGKIDGTDAFTAGISSFPPGLNVPMHSHNVEEMVTVLEGSGECVIDGIVRPVKLWDTTFIPPGIVHCFRNTGTGTMKIMWVYATTNVTRTFAETGITVEHLSGEDLVSSNPTDQL